MNVKGAGYTTNENHVVLGEAQDVKSATNKSNQKKNVREMDPVLKAVGQRGGALRIRLLLVSHVFCHVVRLLGSWKVETRTHAPVKRQCSRQPGGHGVSCGHRSLMIPVATCWSQEPSISFWNGTWWTEVTRAGKEKKQS